MPAYGITNGYEALSSLSYGGYTFWYQMRVPAGATAAVALPVTFWLHQAGRYQSDYATPALAIAAHRADSFGQRADAGSVAGFVVFVPTPDTSNGAKVAYYTVFRRIIEALEAQGFNIDRQHVNACGFSTGGIVWHHLLLRDPTLWNAGCLADGTLISADITDNGSNGPMASLGSIYYDGPTVTVGASIGDGDPCNDVLMFAELARQFALAGVSSLYGRSNIGPIFTPYWGREINDHTLLLTQLALRGVVTGLSSGPMATAMVVPPTDQFHERYFSDADHGLTLTTLYSPTNWPTVQAWFNGRTKPLTYTAPTPVRATAARMLLL